ncbi:MAG: DUF1667 domain-containing protein [Limnochordia bacterium]|nr:DUF1667 domain-containing protein [Limnochordia bacterium]
MIQEAIKKVCIVCPVGCELTIVPGAKEEVTGNRCKRGLEYAIREMTDPRRVLTTTVAIRNAAAPLLPVRTKEPIPKGLLEKAMEVLNKIEVTAPVRMGDIVIEDLLGLGIDVVACKDMVAEED